MSMKPEPLETVQRLARDAAASCDVEVVEVVYRAQGRHTVLRVDIDREGPSGVALADCERVSRRLDELLERDSVFGETPYDLQVSSPGLDRPIRSRDDARRNRGRPVVITIRSSDGSAESIHGILAGIEGRDLVLETKTSGTRRIPWETVVSALPDVGAARSRPKPGRGVKSRKPRDIV